MDTSEQITFGKNPIFGALSLVLSDVASDFRGDLLSLTVLDSLASRFKVPFSLSTVWEKLLNASEIARFVIACGNGHGTNKMEMWLATALQREAQVSLDRQGDMKARFRLLAVLQDMDKQHNAGWFRPESERNVFKTVIRLALETVTKGPAAHFRIDLCRQGMIKLNLKTGDVHAYKPKLGTGDERGSQIAALQSLLSFPSEVDVAGAYYASSNWPDDVEDWNAGRYNSDYSLS